jgi:hypothetical protein
VRPLLALIPLALVLCSCIEGEEVTWLELDGSGRLEAVYKMPPVVMSSFGGPESLATTLREAAARDTHVDLDYVRHRTERGSVFFEFAGSFDDLRNLCTFPQRQLRDPAEPDKPVSAEALFGESTLKISPRGISVHRTIDISGVLPKNIRRAPGLLDDSTFRYILHLPVGAKESNATSSAAGARKLEWTFLLKDHATTPMILTAEAPLPLPSWLWPALAGILLILLALTALVLKRLRRPDTPPATQ